MPDLKKTRHSSEYLWHVLVFLSCPSDNIDNPTDYPTILTQESGAVKCFPKYLPAFLKLLRMLPGHLPAFLIHETAKSPACEE